MPYLIGPNRAAMTPTRNNAMNKMVGESSQKPTTATAATAISASLSRCATRDLSKRSAISPPIAERMKKGKMNMAPANEIRDSASGPAAHLYRIRKTSEFFRKLSLKALKNWHQNRGANRRVVKRLGDMQRSGGWCLCRGGFKTRPTPMSPPRTRGDALLFTSPRLRGEAG